MYVISETWHKQVVEHPEHSDFDLEFAKAHSYPSLNAKSQDALREKRRQWESDLEDLSLLAFWRFLWCPVPALLTRRMVRIAFVGLLIASVLTFVGLPVFHGVILRAVAPHNYRFFDDYVYINGLNWNTDKSEQKNIIIAYERVPSARRLLPGQSPCREILLMDGNITGVYESCFSQILSAQEQSIAQTIHNHICGPGSKCD